jgi:hypothetical protein
MHIAKHFALALIQCTEFFALENLNVAIQNGERSLQVMSSRSQRISSAQIAFAKLRILVEVLLSIHRNELSRGNCGLSGWGGCFLGH